MQGTVSGLPQNASLTQGRHLLCSHTAIQISRQPWADGNPSTRDCPKTKGLVDILPQMPIFIDIDCFYHIMNGKEEECGQSPLIKKENCDPFLLTHSPLDGITPGHLSCKEWQGIMQFLSSSHVPAKVGDFTSRAREESCFYWRAIRSRPQ